MKLWPWSAIRQLEADLKEAGLIVAERNAEIRELVNGRVAIEAEFKALRIEVTRMRTELARLQRQADGRAERGAVPVSIASARTPKAEQHAARAVAQAHPWRARSLSRSAPAATENAQPVNRRDDDTPRSTAGPSERADDAPAFKGAGGAFAGAGATATWGSGDWSAPSSSAPADGGSTGSND